MTKIVVFDLDGTLADGTHREHHLHRPEGDSRPKDWDAYFAACRDDAPIGHIIELYWYYRQRRDIKVEIWTGRIDQYRQDTIDWLQEHLGGRLHSLTMRQILDRTADDELKRRWLHNARADGYEVALAFEDRARVVAMWRAEGVPCLQVAPGDF